ncbi:hypothetical protein J3R82DRAFT_505 [Butyriboletus roseoflavus]|nr:hypothetical protein J3R82DRAFT_505 [Butyriboletus roseoflavus]
MDFNFKVPSTVPQDLLLIQDLIGTIPPLTLAPTHAPDSPDSSDDSITSTDDEIESENEVEADLVPCDEDSGMSAAASDSESNSDSELETSSSSDEGRVYEAPQRKRPADDVEDVDEESDMIAAAAYLQTKNEIVDATIMVPTISEVEPCDTLEKVGEIMSIVGNIVIVRGLPVNHVNSLSKRALDAESLLVFEDRKVFGYIYETFGPTSQPLYQVKFTQRYPLDTDKVWLSREVFHVPQRSHFVFVDQLKKLRGSDASNIHDEEPAEDEVEFSDDEKEAAFRAQHKRRRGRSVSSSRQCTPTPSRIHVDDMVQDTYRGANPYDAHGPYDDDYHVTVPSRPPPIPYDDPYADIPSSDARVRPLEMNGEFGGEPNCESGGDGPKVSRGRIPSRGTRERGYRNRQPWNTSRRGYRHNHVASQRMVDPDTDQSFPGTSRMVEGATGYGQTGHVDMADPLVQPTLNAWFSPEVNDVQHFFQPHINPRFASVFGLGPMIPWASQNAHDHTSQPHHNWADTWTMHGSADLMRCHVCPCVYQHKWLGLQRLGIQLKMILSFVLLTQLCALSGATSIPRLLNNITSGCSTSGPASCQTMPSNTCCTEYPGGLLLQTQFWDTDVAGSPADSWTIHGLWNDNCDGTYDENCDPSRADYNIAQLLSDQGATSTLGYMQRYWLNDNGNNEELWDHEWATHGTCFSTLQTSCFPPGSPQGAEAVAYCETIVRLFQTLPTYTWLADAGITPSTSQTYALSDILSALEAGSGGYTPDLGCLNDGLNTISWYFYLQGSVIDGTFDPISSPGFKDGSCPSTGVRYIPKSG